MTPRIALACIAALLLAGCGSTSGGAVSGNAARPNTVKVFTVTTDSGKDVECIWAKNGYAGGLSCDW